MAHYPHSGESYLIRSDWNGLVFDVFGGQTQAGAHLIQWPAHGGDNQLFTFEQVQGAPQYHYIKNKKSGRYLMIEGGSTAIGAKLTQADFNGSDAQRFNVDHNDDGTLCLRVKKGGHHLGIPSTRKKGGRLFQWSINRGEHQRFRLYERIPSTLTIDKIRCVKMQGGGFDIKSTFEAFSTTAGLGIGVASAGLAVAGVTTGGTALAVVGVGLAVTSITTWVAGLAGADGAPDQVYMTVNGKKVWPSSKSEDFTPGVERSLDYKKTGWTAQHYLELWERDTGSADDPLTNRVYIDPIYSAWDQVHEKLQSVMVVGNPDEGSVYEIFYRFQ